MKITNDFIDNNIFLYDVFANEIILKSKKDDYAPPERYFEVGANKDDGDYYVDTLWIEYPTKCLDFAYSYEESWNKNPRWLEMLYDFIESKGLPRTSYQLKRRMYPRKRFKRLLKQYYRED